MIAFGNHAGDVLLKNLDNETKISSDTIFNESMSEAVSLFNDIWDIEVLQDDFEVHFYSTIQSTAEEQKIVSIQKSPNTKNKIEIKFNDDFMNQIVEIEKQVNSFYDNFNQDQQDQNSIKFAQFRFTMRIGSWFQKNNLANGVLFIPAGRQAFTIPKDERPAFSQDFFMKNFYEYTVEQKKSFREPISQKLSDKKKEDFPPKRVECLELVQDLTSKILKGEYVSPRDDERIYFDKEHYVKLYEASSGQQEALWILNSIYSSIEQRQERFTIIEEPEAHLYPETQKATTELISLLANQPGNQVMITTHSPYILTALNNLLYAHKIGKTKPDEVAEVIDPLLWVDISHVAAYKVENGGIRDIVDRELGMIIPEEIDALPKDPIVEDYEKLFALDDCNDAD